MKVKTKANKSADQKFVGVRLDPERAEQLTAMADARGVSLNQFVATILNSADDSTPEATATAAKRQVVKSLDAQSVSGDDLHTKIQRLHALVVVRDRIEKKRDVLNSEKPEEGPITRFLNAAELQAWRTKAQELEEKYHKIVAKIDALEEEVLRQETDAVDEGEGDQGDDDESAEDRAVTEPKQKNSKQPKPKSSFLQRAGLLA